jgi:uncharacterized membrane protein
LDLVASPRGRAVATLAAAGEGVVDTLPQTPSRLAAGPLVGRVLIGMAGGVALALRSASVPASALPRTVLIPAALVGGASAAAGSYLGAGWRSRAPFGHDLPAALIEDVVVTLLSWAAARP